MDELDPIIHQTARLRLMAFLCALAPGDEVEFTLLRDQMGLTDGNLGAHLLKLETAGYIAVNKTFVARKPKTFLAATPSGRAAFEHYKQSLRAILEEQPQ